MRSRAPLSLVVLLVVALAGCGGGGGGSAAAPVPTVAPTVTPTPASGLPAAGAANVVLPSSAGYAGTVSFPASNIAAGVSVTFTAASALQAPSPLDSLRHIQSSATALAVWQMSFSGSTALVTFNGSPTLQVAIPTGVNGASLVVEIFDSTQSGSPLLTRLVPTVNGGTVTFSGTAPLTLSSLGDTFWVEIVQGAASGPLTVSPTSLAFGLIGQTLLATVSDPNYTGSYQALGCIGTATATFPSSATLSVTSINLGACTLTLLDTTGQTVNIPITVTTLTVPIQGVAR